MAAKVCGSEGVSGPEGVSGLARIVDHYRAHHPELNADKLRYLGACWSPVEESRPATRYFEWRGSVLIHDDAAHGRDQDFGDEYPACDGSCYNIAKVCHDADLAVIDDRLKFTLFAFEQGNRVPTEIVIKFMETIGLDCGEGWWEKTIHFNVTYPDELRPIIWNAQKIKVTSGVDGTYRFESESGDLLAVLEDPDAVFRRGSSHVEVFANDRMMAISNVGAVTSSAIVVHSCPPLMVKSALKK